MTGSAESRALSASSQAGKLRRSTGIEASDRMQHDLPASIWDVPDYLDRRASLSPRWPIITIGGKTLDRNPRPCPAWLRESMERSRAERFKAEG